MDYQHIIAKLHPLERAVLPALKTTPELSGIIAASGLQEIEVLRALQWLENKEILILHSETKPLVVLGKNGEQYLREGLPEKKVLRALTSDFQELSSIIKKAKIGPDEIKFCLGTLKKIAAIDFRKEKTLQVKILTAGKKLLEEDLPEQIFLQKKFPIYVRDLSTLDQYIYTQLIKRPDILHQQQEKKVTVELTNLGKELLKQDLSGKVINRVTSGMLKDGSWREKKFRAYDIESRVSTILGGRKHFDTEAIDYIRQIWVEMGFKEMRGNYIQSAFWDLDVLFVPQDHPAREMQDTFYLEGKAKLPSWWEKVKKVHEQGGDTGSRGWGNHFSREEAEQVLLRTHTTVLSVQTISKLRKEDLPAKLFAIGRVFRNEALDWKHLFEFYQVEGIVVDPNANLKHLKGYLRQFYHKMGYEQIRMRPAHFPYTEPSLEVDVFHPVKKEWVELGGAGIFRPEVVKPLLGFDCPVLAWGQGMARIIAEYWKITDIRDIYNNDLKQIREAKMWLK